MVINISIFISLLSNRVCFDALQCRATPDPPHADIALLFVCLQMVFGFRSMDYLKTHTMSYSATAEQYAPYFTRMMSDYSSYYAGAPEGSVMEKDEKWPLIIAAAVMITPILLLAGLVVSR